VATRKRRTGRTPKLTPDVPKLIVDAVAACAPRKYAAERAGVDDSTVRKWLIAGRKQKTGIFRTFFTLLKKAEADAIITRVARISKAAQGGQVIEETTKSVTTFDKNGKPVTTTTTTKKHAPPQWVADAWMLEHRCPDEFALQRKKDIQDAVKAELAKAVKNGEIKPPDQNDGATSSETPPT
jgi:hypothetical protein